ncbi:MAG: hypothetical protein HXY20_12500 [Acidobacteria bacterium]|nr:hypothetical protein [Acidobacteriota bacterium]
MKPKNHTDHQERKPRPVRLRRNAPEWAVIGILPRERKCRFLRAATRLALGICVLAPASSQSWPQEWVSLGPQESETPLRIGRQAQLLMDNHVLCDWWQVRRVLGPVRKHSDNPVLQADRDWERHSAKYLGVQPTAAIYDEREQIFKLWYTVLQPEGGGTAYATSSDGIHWTKPILGLIEFAGTRSNNLCRLEPFGRLVRGLRLVQDPRERSPDRRYLAIGTWPVHPDGTWYAGWAGVAYSSDGVSWHQIEGGFRDGAGGDRPSCVWDERLQRYVSFHRQLTERALPERIEAHGLKRYIVRQESADLKKWSPRQTAFNSMDSDWPHIESMSVYLRHGVYIGLAAMLDIQRTGRMEVHLAASRDGFDWRNPCPGRAFIPLGAPGDFDDTLVYGCQLATRGDLMYIYYAGARYSHAYTPEPIVDDGGSIRHVPGGKGQLQFRPNRIGLATLEADRFAGLRADEPLGAFLTRPLYIEGEELYVNASVDRELRVEVVDAAWDVSDSGPKEDWTGHYVVGTERLVPGFSRKDCQAIIGDSLRHCVRWKGGSIGKLKGRSVRLRFIGRLATVYAFQIQ